MDLVRFDALRRKAKSKMQMGEASPVFPTALCMQHVSLPRPEKWPGVAIEQFLRLLENCCGWPQIVRQFLRLASAPGNLGRVAAQIGQL